MPTTPPPDTLENLPRTPASDVKKLGWRGVMDTVRREGGVAVTNHGRPEAVILPADQYERLLNRLHDAGKDDRARMEALRRRYDERLQWLDQPGARETLDAIFDKPLDLGGKIFTGNEF